jgi:drug/metabolite transporter (DMT)-like permease
MRINKRLNLLLLIVLTLCWGPSFFFIKIALQELSAFSIATARFCLAAFILFLIAKTQRQLLWKWLKFLKHFLVMSIIGCSSLFLINYAEQSISSSLAGIINATQPLFTSILAHYMLETERFSIKSLIGIGIGLSGILFIFLPSLLMKNHTNVLGIIIMTTAALSNSFSAVYAKKFLSHVPSLVSATYQFTLGSILILPCELFLSPFHSWIFPSWKVIVSLLILGFFGSGLAYIIFYYLVKHAGATYVSTVSLLLPFVAIALGVSFLNETLYWTTYAGCILIILGLIVTNSLVSMKTLVKLVKHKQHKPDV